MSCTRCGGSGWEGAAGYAGEPGEPWPCTKCKRSSILKNSTDTLDKWWKSQEDFMRLLQEKRGFPEFPVDIKSKPGQRFLKEIIHDCQDELGEARVLLKNSKNHRETEIVEFDRQGYIEELVDAEKFLLETLILSGVTLEEFKAAFEAKTDINIDRIKKGY